MSTSFVTPLPGLADNNGFFSSSLVINDEAFGCLMLMPHLQLAVLDLVRVRTSYPISRKLCRLVIQHRATHRALMTFDHLRPSIRRDDHRLLYTRPKQGAATRIKSISTLYCCLWMNDDVSIRKISSSSPACSCSGPCFLRVRVASYGESFQA